MVSPWPHCSSSSTTIQEESLCREETVQDRPVKDRPQAGGWGPAGETGKSLDPALDRVRVSLCGPGWAEVFAGIARFRAPGLGAAAEAVEWGDRE